MFYSMLNNVYDFIPCNHYLIVWKKIVVIGLDEIFFLIKLLLQHNNFDMIGSGWQGGAVVSTVNSFFWVLQFSPKIHKTCELV